MNFLTRQSSFIAFYIGKITVRGLSGRLVRISALSRIRLIALEPVGFYDTINDLAPEVALSDCFTCSTLGKLLVPTSLVLGGDEWSKDSLTWTKLAC